MENLVHRPHAWGPKGRRRVFGASVIGSSHQNTSMPCQDACFYDVLPSGAIFIAAADGLGSASRSDVGAQLAVTSAFHALESVCTPFPDSLCAREESLRQVAGEARRSLEDRAAADVCDIREFACTLILAILEENNVAVAHIGDGAAVVETDGELHLLSGPAESEYANEVTPLTSGHWEYELRLASMNSDLQGIAVLTDGCQRASLRKTEAGYAPFDRFFFPIFSYARQVSETSEGAKELEALLHSQRMCENCDDDKTLVVGITNGI